MITIYLKLTNELRIKTLSFYTHWILSSILYAKVQYLAFVGKIYFTQIEKMIF